MSENNATTTSLFGGLVNTAHASSDFTFRSDTVQDFSALKLSSQSDKTSKAVTPNTRQSTGPTSTTTHELFPGLSWAYHTGDYADFEIVCRKEHFRVHRIILCTQSSFFRALMNGSFAEANNGVVQLEDENPKLVKLCLQFLYTSSYYMKINSKTHRRDETMFPSIEGDERDLSIHAGLYALGDKWGIPHLQKEASYRYLSVINEYKLIWSFADSMRIICDGNRFPSTDKGLLPAVITHAAKWFIELSEKQNFQDLLEDMPGVEKLILEARKSLPASTPAPVSVDIVLLSPVCPKCQNVEGQGQVEMTEPAGKSFYCVKCRRNFTIS